jgi:hypothetical protein
MERDDVLESIDKRLAAIEKKLGIIDDTLNTHISFIERTYSVLRTPLSFVTNKVNSLLCIRGQPKTLPSIQVNE